MTNVSTNSARRINRSAQRRALDESTALMRQATPLITAVLLASMRAELRQVEADITRENARLEALEAKGELCDYTLLDRMSDRYEDIIESYAKYGKVSA